MREQDAVDMTVPQQARASTRQALIHVPATLATKEMGLIARIVMSAPVNVVETIVL